MTRNRLILAVCLALLVPVLNCSHQSSSDAGYIELLKQQKEAPVAGSLGVGDEFELKVHKEEDISGTYTVSGDGSINVPLIGSVEVGGLKCGEVETVLARKLEDGYLKNATVSCDIKKYRSRRIYVFGQVKEPGSFSYTSNITVIEAVALAGGMTKLAAPNSATLTREIEGDEIQIEIPLQDIVEGKKPSFRLFPGDILFIPESVY